MRRTPATLWLEQRKLRRRLRLDTYPVVAGEAGVAEMRRIVPRRLQHAVEREVAQGVGAQIATNLFHVVTGTDQLLAGRGIDPVVTRPLDRRRRDPDVNGLGAGSAHH